MTMLDNEPVRTADREARAVRHAMALQALLAHPPSLGWDFQYCTRILQSAHGVFRYSDISFDLEMAERAVNRVCMTWERKKFQELTQALQDIGQPVPWTACAEAADHRGAQIAAALLARMKADS